MRLLEYINCFSSELDGYLITEKVISIGINPEHEKYRAEYRQRFFDMLRHAYADIGGYDGLGSGTEEEAAAINADLDNLIIKAIRRGEDITSIRLYKDQYGRKAVGAATDNTLQGKRDFLRLNAEDHRQKRSWSEVSGKAEDAQRRLGVPVIPVDQVPKLTGKKIVPDEDGIHYSRDIGGVPRRKIALGHPKID